MLKKLENNINKIIPIIGIIACGLIMPSFLELLDNDFNEGTIFSLIQDGLMLAGNIVLIVTAFKGKKSVLLPAILYFSGFATYQLYSFIENQSIMSFVYLSLYVFVIVMLIMAFMKKALNVLYVGLLLVIAFFISSTLSGSAFGLSCLLSAVSFTSLIYLDNKKEEESTNE